MSAAYPGLGAIHWRSPIGSRLLFLASAGLVLLAFRHGLSELLTVWETQEEYSYGYVIPFVAAYFLWNKLDELAPFRLEGSWWGTALVLFGLLCLGLGRISTLGTIVQYGFLIVLAGMVLSCTGTRAFRVLAAPLSILMFMVPLPNYLLLELSQWLQGISSQLGVAVIRLFGISVYLEGNVIDLGSLKLQVVEACNGLRYLFPLTALSYIAAYLYQAPLWKRALIVLSAGPITVLMNSFRIGLIGVMVEFSGRSAAEGVLHDFEGWLVFMACIALILLEMWVLSRIGNDRRPLGEVFGLPQAVRVQGAVKKDLGMPASYVAAVALVAVSAFATFATPAPERVLPERASFSDFPMSLGEWSGHRGRLDPEIIEALKLDDYILADFQGPDASLPVNFYASYYATQADGNSAHSPRACIPGDGWEISELTQRNLGRVEGLGEELKVNRVIIQKGERRQLVYYWFQQRGHIITDEYMVKLRIFQDSLLRKRSDGAMVRLVARLRPGEQPEMADRQLESFIHAMVPRLPAHVPD